MSVLFNVTHEAGDLSEYDSTVTDSGDLSAHADAALANTAYGLKCVIDDTNALYGRKDFSSSNNTYRCRFYIDPNGLTIGAWDSFTILALNSGSHDILLAILSIDGSSQYRIKTALVDDSSSFHSTSYYTISDAEHYIEIELNRASGAAANDASMQLWIDGVSKETVSNKDLYDDWGASHADFGAVGNIDSGTSGTLYLDELKANDDGSEIGPRVGVPIFMNSYRTGRI